MLTLAINTASSFTAIALLDSQNLLRERSWQSHNDEAEKLMPAIDSLIKEHGKSYEDIKKIVAIKGPGSFTGLRVGITVANTISYLNKCDLFTIDTFSYWHSINSSTDSSTDSTPEKALLIFAGSKGVYVSLEGKDPENISLDKLNEYLSSKKIKKAFGDITDAQKVVLEIPFEENHESFGEIISKISSEKLEKEIIIKPNYIKSPGITLSKKTLLN